LAFSNITPIPVSPTPHSICVFEAHHGVRSRRDWRACHNAEGGAGLDTVFGAGRSAGRQVAGHFEAAGRIAARTTRVGRLHGIAVHRGVIEGRDIHIAPDVGGQHQAERFRQRHLHDFQRSEVGKYGLERLGDAHTRKGLARSCFLHLISPVLR
jgi:hypothetical protein